MSGEESIISIPRIVVVDLPDLPRRRIPGYNIFFIVTILGFTSLCIYKNRF
jgi:hypothetical protein